MVGQRGWVVGGDFNTILTPIERLSKSQSNQESVDEYRNATFDLVEVPVIGGAYLHGR